MYLCCRVVKFALLEQWLVKLTMNWKSAQAQIIKDDLPVSSDKNCLHLTFKPYL